MASQQLDCMQLNCPMPIVKISRAVKMMTSDETLEVLATDPAFEADLNAWIDKTGHELVSFDEGDVKKAIIRKI